MQMVIKAVLLLGPLVVAIVFHEVAHGWAARWLGDPTAAEQRRLSFNPLRHVDPVGTVLLPLALALASAPVFGWAKPVPVDARRLREPRTGMMLVALAGPGMNMLLATVAAVLLALATQDGLSVGGLVATVLIQFILINVFLALFNLLPIPPFDGGHVVEGLLPRPLAAQYAKLARFGFPLLIVLLLVVPRLFPGANVVARVVAPPAAWLSHQFLQLAGVVG